MIHELDVWLQLLPQRLQLLIDSLMLGQKPLPECLILILRLKKHAGGV